ncbi:MAG: TIGR02147 family protein [Fibrobacterales bacterium]
MKPIYEFLDYREFLKEFYEEKKAENFFFSFQHMGQRVDMDASYLAKIVSAQRHIPVKKIPAFLKLCELTGSKADYFETLVFFCRAKSDKETKLHYENLIKLRAVKGFTLTSIQYKFYSKWYYTAIRAMLGLNDFSDEYEEIARKLDPPLRPLQVKQAITFMLRSKIIENTDAGVLKPTYRHISSGKASDRQAIRTFQKEMLTMASRSLEAHPPEERDISTITVAINKNTMESVKKIIEDCREAIRQCVDMDKNPDTIYQVNFQVYPLSREGKE